MAPTLELTHERVDDLPLLLGLLIDASSIQPRHDPWGRLSVTPRGGVEAVWTRRSPRRIVGGNTAVTLTIICAAQQGNTWMVVSASPENPATAI